VSTKKSLLCRIGAHRWRKAFSDEGVAFRQCDRCGKEGEYNGLGAAWGG
jgi:hypothetical protein